MHNRSISYTDGLVLLAESNENLIEQVGKLLDMAKRVGLEKNAEKSECMMRRGEVADQYTHI